MFNHRLEFEHQRDKYYYRARFYDPVIARFLSEDPIRLKSGDLNLYRYVFNNPVKTQDPSGEVALAIISAAGIYFFLGDYLSGNDDRSPRYVSPFKENNTREKSWLIEESIRNFLNKFRHIDELNENHPFIPKKRIDDPGECLQA